MHDISRRVYDEDGISPTIHTMGGGNTEVKIIQRERGNNPGGIIETDTAPTVTANAYEQNVFVVVGAIRGRNPEDPTDRTAGLPTEQMLEPGSAEHTNAITTVQKDNVVIEPIVYDEYNGRERADQSTIGTLTTNCGSGTSGNGFRIIEPVSTRGNDTIGTIRATVYKNGSRNIAENLMDGKGYEGVVEPADEKSDKGVIILNGRRCRVRKLTPLECWRLFAFTDEQFYTAKATLEEKFYKGKDKASSQLYKQAGNTIVIPVLEAILGNVKGIEKAW